MEAELAAVGVRAVCCQSACGGQGTFTYNINPAGTVAGFYFDSQPSYKTSAPCATGDYQLRLKDGREYTVTRTYKKNLSGLAAFWIGTGTFLN